jgi:GSCFA family protein
MDNSEPLYGGVDSDSQQHADDSSGCSAYRLPVWRMPEEAAEYLEPERWYKGEYCNKFPYNRRKDLEDVLHGWVPPTKLITAETKVLAFGSCFALYFIQFLSRCGYNRWQTPVERHSQSDENLLLVIPSSFENIFVIAQQFRWAFNEFTPNAKLWFTKDKRLFEATEERRHKVRLSLRDADVFVITLGLSEVWFDQIAGEPMWRAIPSRLYEPDRHVCKSMTVADTLVAFQELDALADRYLDGKRFIFTLSPIPLTATFRNQSAITANQVSKAVLRAALDEFLSRPSIAQKSRYHYFPSYEIVFNLIDTPFLPDNLHIRPEAAETVIGVFRNLYTDLPPSEIRIAGEESHMRGLEEQVRTLHQEMEAKERVIRELDQAARERLELIQRLTQTSFQV